MHHLPLVLSIPQHGSWVTAAGVICAKVGG